MQVEESIFDAQGFRFNVGIVLMNERGQLFWAKRFGYESWQFPQGGMHAGESDEQAMYRELYEEVGLLPEQVELLGKTDGWLLYRLPARFRRPRRQGLIQCVGQKQRWFLLKLKVEDSEIQLNRLSPPEFDRWRWVDYDEPPRSVIHFKRKVYAQALEQLSIFRQ